MGAAEHPPGPLRFTIISATEPATLTKTLGVKADGTLLKISGGNLIKGHARHAAAVDLRDLAAQLDGLQKNEAVTWGTPDRTEAPVVAQYLKPQHSDAITRTRKEFRFASGPGVMMFDHDDMLPGVPPDADPATIRALLVHACPALDGAPMLARPSASAGVYTADGRTLAPPGRWRLYIPVTNAADIPEAGKRLLSLLWAAGFGWFRSGEAGQLLERHIVDAAVWTPEHLDFAARAVLLADVQQPRVAPVFYGERCGLFDLSLIVSDGAQDERAREARLGARSAAAPAAAAARQTYADRKAPAFAERTGRTLEEARAVLALASEKLELEHDFTLTLKDGKQVTVDEILTDPARFDGARLRDPLEPEYNDDPRIAVVLCGDGEPTIFSHAHGGMRYRLLPNLKRVYASGAAAAAAVPAVTAAPVPATTTTTGAALTFLDLAHGSIPATLDTVYDKLTAKDSGVRIALDEFKEEIMIARNGEAWARFTDVHYGRLRAEFGRRGFKPIPAEIMKTAVLMASEDHRFDSAKDWANSLQWDGTARIDAALPTYYRTKDTPYTRAVGAYLFTALAARALSPGCQADMVVVLIGLQGERKTSAVRALCPEPDAFAEINLKKIDDDNMARHIRGKLVGEMSELRGLTGRDQESVKAWITRRVEVWRPVYREFETSYPRRLVFIGTSNEREFLDDPTGERRWLPVDAGSADVEGIERDRDQLWAEGIARFRVSGVAWRDAETLARGEHENFKVADPWQDDITQWLDAPVTPAGPPRRASPFKLADVMRGALGKPVANFQRADEKRAAKVLRSLGYEKKNGRDGGSVCKLWTRATP